MADRYEDRYRGEDYRRDRWYGRDYDRDRGFFDRAGDEVRSWFGDEEAERRRRMDEARYGRYSGRDYGPEPRREYGYGRDWDRYGRDWDRYGRDWDFGHRMGFDYGRPREWRERGWSDERWGPGERPSTSSDYWRPGWPGYWTEAGGYPADFPRYGQPSFAGRGPRGYQRTDDRMREDVCERLTADPWIDASDVEVTVRAGEVTLSGTVRDRNEKRHAEDLAERTSGVREVHNNLRVGSGWEGSAGRGREQGTTTAGTATTGAGSRR